MDLVVDVPLGPVSNTEVIGAVVGVAGDSVAGFVVFVSGIVVDSDDEDVFAYWDAARY